METLSPKFEIVPIVRTGQPVGCGGEDRTPLSWVSDDLMDVCVDVEGRNDPCVVIAENSSDVDIDIQGVVGIESHRSHISRRPPWGVPLVTTGRSCKELVLGEGVSVESEQSCFVGANPDCVWCRLNAERDGAGRHAGDGLGVSMDSALAIDSPPGAVVSSQMIDPGSFDERCSIQPIDADGSADQKIHVVTICCRPEIETEDHGRDAAKEAFVGIIVLVGRVLFALIAVGSSFAGHFGDTANMTAYAESRGLKNARPIVLISGVWLLLAGVSMIIGFYPDVGALMLAVFTLSATFLIHHFWSDEDQMTKQIEMTNFMKNLSITGAALIAFAYFVTVGEAGPFQITGNLIDL